MGRTNSPRKCHPDILKNNTSFHVVTTLLDYNCASRGSSRSIPHRNNSVMQEVGIVTVWKIRCIMETPALLPALGRAYDKIGNGGKIPEFDKFFDHFCALIKVLDFVQQQL